MIPAGWRFQGYRLRQARVAMKLSYVRFTMRLTKEGHVLDPDTLRRWEVGGGEPRVSVAASIARITNRPIDWFFGPAEGEGRVQ